MNTKAVRLAARAMLAELPHLLDSEAGELERELTAIPDSAPDDMAAVLITNAINRYESTRKWMDVSIRLEAARARGFQPLPGVPNEIPAPVFVCPDGHWSWVRLRPEPVPACIHCGKLLAPKP